MCHVPEALLDDVFPSYPMEERRVGTAVDELVHDAVLADGPMRARDAVDLIEAEWEALPVVSSVEDALAEGAPLIHARGLVKQFGNLTAVDGIDFDVQRGEAALREAVVLRARHDTHHRVQPPRTRGRR